MVLEKKWLVYKFDLLTFCMVVVLVGGSNVFVGILKHPGKKKAVLNAACFFFLREYFVTCMRLTASQIEKWRSRVKPKIEECDDKHHEEEKTQFVYVDTAARISGSSNDFIINLKQIRTGKYMKIHSVNLPHHLTPYITKGSSMAWYVYNNSHIEKFQVLLEPGARSWSCLAEEVEQAMNSISSYTFKVFLRGNSMVIESLHSKFKLIVDDNSIWKQIGYLPKGNKRSQGKSISYRIKAMEMDTVTRTTIITCHEPHRFFNGDKIGIRDGRESRIATIVEIIGACSIRVDCIFDPSKFAGAVLSTSLVKIKRDVNIKVCKILCIDHDLLMTDVPHELEILSEEPRIIDVWGVTSTGSKTTTIQDKIKVVRIVDDYMIEIEPLTTGHTNVVFWQFITPPNIQLHYEYDTLAGTIRDTLDEEIIIECTSFLTKNQDTVFSIETFNDNWNTSIVIKHPSEWNKVMVCCKEMAEISDLRGILTNVVAIVDTHTDEIITQTTRTVEPITRLSISIRNAKHELIPLFDTEWSFVLEIC